MQRIWTATRTAGTDRRVPQVPRGLRWTARASAVAGLRARSWADPEWAILHGQPHVAGVGPDGLVVECDGAESGAPAVSGAPACAAPASRCRCSTQSRPNSKRSSLVCSASGSMPSSMIRRRCENRPSASSRLRHRAIPAMACDWSNPLCSRSRYAGPREAGVILDMLGPNGAGKPNRGIRH